MPEFHSVNTGRAAWSDAHNTSQRITTGSARRPEAEVKLKNRNIQIRTGARVTRARGPWVGFKKMFTWAGHGISEGFHGAGLHFLARSKDVINERKLRHAEHQFDRNVNRLVEDLANEPNLSPADVTKRMNKIAKQADIIAKLDPSMPKPRPKAEEHELAQVKEQVNQRLAERFDKNLKESLSAVATHKPEALDQVVKAFGQGGKLADMKNQYTYHNDPDKENLADIERHEQSRPPTAYDKAPTLMYHGNDIVVVPRDNAHKKMPTAADYIHDGTIDPDLWDDSKQTKKGLATQDQHNFGQLLIDNMSSTVNDDPAIRRQATAAALKKGLSTSSTYKSTVSKDFIKEQVTMEKKPVTEHINDRINGSKIDDEYAVSEDYLKDVGRATMTFTEPDGQSVELKQQLNNHNINHTTTEGGKQAKQMATNQMLAFANDNEIAAKNLSRLMHQQVIRSLTGAGTKQFNKDYGVMLSSGNEKIAHNLTKEANGDVIFESRKRSTISHVVATKPFQLNENKNNSIEEVVKIRIRNEDLNKEPLQYELLEAKTHYNFDTTGAKPA